MDPVPAAPDAARESGPFGAAGMARTLAYFYVAGGILGLLSLLAPSAPEANTAGVVGNCVVALIAGFVLVIVGRRLPPAAITLFLAGGTLMITSAVYFDNHADSVYSFFYVWVGVEAFCFLGRRPALLQIAFMATCYAWVLGVVGSGPVSLQRWVLTVGVALVTGLLVGSLRDHIERLLERLSGAARTDVLTGIPNRRAFEERFEEELSRARREGRQLSVALGDLDGFKLVNDRLGHLAGDEALRKAARELTRWKRRSDLASRIGGEEFALLLPATDEAGASALADRVRLGVREVFAGDSVPLTVSFGIATFPAHGEDADTLLQASDQALYAAKEMGKNRCVAFTTELAETLESSRAQVVG